MKQFKKRFSILGLAMLGVLSLAGVKAEANDSILSFGALVGAAFNSPRLSSANGNTSFSSDGNAAFVGGLTAEIGLPMMFGVEVDLLYTKQKFSQDTAQFFGTNVTSTTSSGNIQIPVILRFRPIPFLNPGVGLYYSRVVTSWTVSADNFNSTTIDYGKNDFGFVLALGTSIPIFDVLNIVADVRYTRSFNDSGGSTNNSLKFSQLQLLAGLRFDL